MCLSVKKVWFTPMPLYLRGAVFKTVNTAINRVGTTTGTQDCNMRVLKHLSKAVLPSLSAILRTAIPQAYSKTVQQDGQKATDWAVCMAVQEAVFKAAHIGTGRAATKAGSKYPCKY